MKEIKKIRSKITEFYENKNLDFDNLDKFLQMLFLEGHHDIFIIKFKNLEIIVQ